MGTLRAVPDAGPADLWGALQGWDRWLTARGLSDATRRGYRAAILGMAVDTFSDPLSMTETAFVDYLNAIPARGRKRDQVVKAARSFYPWAMRHGAAASNPAEDIHPGRHPQGSAPYLTEDELRRVLRAAFRRDRRRGWALMLLYATGARESSLAGVQISDVDLERRWIEFRVAKGGQTYGVPLGRRGFYAARWLVADARRTSRTSLVGIRARTFWSWATEAGEAAGLKVWPHLLRHTFGTELASDPRVDLRTWCEAMGHRDPGQFRRYAAARPSALREAMERF